MVFKSSDGNAGGHRLLLDQFLDALWLHDLIVSCTSDRLLLDVGLFATILSPILLFHYTLITE